MQAVDEMKYLMRDLQTHELNLADSKDAEAQQKNIKNIESINSRFHDLMDGYTENSKGLEGVPERIDAANKPGVTSTRRASRSRRSPRRARTTRPARNAHAGTGKRRIFPGAPVAGRGAVL